MAPTPTPTSRPGRLLASLAVLVILLLFGVVHRNLFSPGNWAKDFKVQLGLDLSSGTAVTLQAQTLKGANPSPGEMNEAVSIMNNRVNGAGFTGATVVPLGNRYIVVSVPGKTASQVVKYVGTTAQLRFRQVLLEAPNYTKAAAANPSSSPSPSPSASPGSSASPTPSASPAPSASPSASQTSSRQLSTTSDAAGNASLVSAPVAKLFDKLNCADANWQSRIYHDQPVKWDNEKTQIVSCKGSGSHAVKYVLDKAKVSGTDLSSAGAQYNSSNQWVVVFNLKSGAASRFSALTTNMLNTYGTTSVLDQFAIVLDGKVISAPVVTQAITGGSGQITGPNNGSFSQSYAGYLANILKYGALPLTFRAQSINSVSPQLGSAQLAASLIAAAVGLLLVVIYSFLYYRGLGLVSISSLTIAGGIAYLAVVLLSKYEGFTLTLAGVAGLIVAIGITADSFVVYFERLRDEVREGRSLRAAVERGWQRARRTILVSDTVSFLAAALLYYFAIGDVRGFAFTLGLTTIIDVVVVFLFTKPMVTLLARTKFYGRGHKLSGLDPARLGARAPWRGSRRPTPRPATSASASDIIANPRES